MSDFYFSLLALVALCSSLSEFFIMRLPILPESNTTSILVSWHYGTQALMDFENKYQQHWATTGSLNDCSWDRQLITKCCDLIPHWVCLLEASCEMCRWCSQEGGMLHQSQMPADHEVLESLSCDFRDAAPVVNFRTGCKDTFSAPSWLQMVTKQSPH